MESHFITHLHTGCNVNVLPNTNLPMNIPLVEFQSPKNFTIKDQHLLKPPQVMGASNTKIFISIFLNDLTCICFFKTIPLEDELQMEVQIIKFLKK